MLHLVYSTALILKEASGRLSIPLLDHHHHQAHHLGTTQMTMVTMVTIPMTTMTMTTMEEEAGAEAEEDFLFLRRQYLPHLHHQAVIPAFHVPVLEGKANIDFYQEAE